MEKTKVLGEDALIPGGMDVVNRMEMVFWFIGHAILIHGYLH